VVFVGEPTAQNVNQFGDNKKIILPNSGIKVRASHLWWQDMDPRDTRRWTDPELTNSMTSADFFTNRDPALEAIARYTPRPRLDDILDSAFETGGAEAALAAYRDFKADPANRYVKSEGVINQVGYALLGMQMVDAAITFFKLNVEAYPDSANAYDSLAEANMKQGDKESALVNYEKALAIDPGNSHAAEMLEKLRE
jgi:tetratricopeptide (TPR) repeat protein